MGEALVICVYHDTFIVISSMSFTSFSNYCIKMLDNNGLQYNDREVCSLECATEGGSLASIHSEEENYFIFGLLNSACPSGSCGGNYPPFRKTWIGSQPDSLHYQWMDGTPVRYSWWNSGEPSTCPAKGCVYIGGFSTGPMFVDSDCISQEIRYDCACKKRI